MVNMGRIHKELGKFLMISSNLIKSYNESGIEIGKIDVLGKGTRRRIHGITEFDFDFADQSKIQHRRFLEKNYNQENQNLREKSN